MTDWKAKEYYTIQLDGIPVQRIGSLLRETFGICADTVKKSHFYTEEAGGFEYSDALDLDAYFAERSSASFHLSEIRMDRAYRDGSCVIYSDGISAALECDIEEHDFDMQRMPELKAWLTEQVCAEIAENASISFSFDDKQLFEIGKGELQ